MLETLRVFVDIVEQQSFSRAALKSYITQSAVSQRIRQLEQEVGQSLLLRGRGNVRPTEAGRLYYDACKKILDHYDRTIEQINELDDVISGQVSLGTITSVGLHELPVFVKSFLQRYPLVALQVEYRTSPAIYEGLVDFSLDVGIVAYPERHPQVVVVPMRHDELLLITPPGHPLARFQKVGIQKLDQLPFVAFAADIPTRRAVDKMLRQKGVDVRIIHQFDNVETIKRAVEIGAGVSIVPKATVKQELETGSLRGIQFRGLSWQRPLGILYKKGRTLRPAAEKLIHLLQNGAGD